MRCCNNAEAYCWNPLVEGIDSLSRDRVVLAGFVVVSAEAREEGVLLR